MSAQIQFLPIIENCPSDVQFVEAHCETILQMLTILHGALCEITKSSNALEMRSIAEITLCEVQNISQTMGVAKFMEAGGHNA